MTSIELLARAIRLQRENDCLRWDNQMLLAERSGARAAREQIEREAVGEWITQELVEALKSAWALGMTDECIEELREMAYAISFSERQISRNLTTFILMGIQELRRASEEGDR